MKIIDIIMLAAPIGVFSLMTALIVEIPDASTLGALLAYALTVLTGLILVTFGVYPLLLLLLGKVNPLRVFKELLPAQLLALSTSSSAATLPVTMERVIEHVGVDEDVASFVLPLGATVNMDGTSLYQAVAAIFIAQALGIELDLSTQLMIIITATLASIGSAAVPSAGMVMLVIVLGQAGIPEAGLALIFAIDRPLDMCRTVTNITGDATVATIVAKSVGKLKPMKN
jgi:Na+/H+-dicarboxylate symporter